MSKRNRNIRARKLDSDSEEENVQAAPPTKANNNKQDTGKQSTTVTAARLPLSSSMLSFEVDEGEEFQIKKSNYNKKVAKQLKKENEIKDTKKVKPQKNSSVSMKKLKISDEEDNDDDECVVDDDDDGDGKSRSTKKNVEPSVHEILKSGEIPDANLIHLARKRRQMARECGEDFIPLDETRRFEKNNSRLIRDDDNDMSDSGDETNVLVLTSKQKDAQRRWIEEKILAAEEDSNSDREQEKEWEEQQIKKGTSIPAQSVVFSTGGHAEHLATGYHHQPPFVFSANGGLVNYTVQNSLSALGEAERLAMADIAKSKPKKTLKQRHEELAEKLRQNRQERSDLESRREEAVLTSSELEKETVILLEDYKFFQELREFTKDYVECMNEKMSSVSYLERCMMDLLKQRAEKLVARRQEDVRDQSLEYFPGKQSVAADGSLDDSNKTMRRAEREGRRTRRKREREKKGVKNHCDGLSTDDEQTTSDAKKFDSEKERLTTDCKTALTDVDEEFCSIPNILSRFEKWKRDRGESYVGAYIGLCLPKLFAPLIKLQLITWNPLETYCRNFEKCQWFQDLLFYGSLQDTSKDVSATNIDEEQRPSKDSGGCGGDDDVRLLPNIIDKILVPKITGVVEAVWDPLSLRQTASLKKVVNQLAYDYPYFVLESKNTQSLIKAINQRILKCLKNDIFMPLYARNVLENRNSVASVFFYRQLYSCVKLFNSVVMWQGIISDQGLQSLSLDQLLNRYVMIGLQSAPFNSELLSICQTISGLIPKEWFTEYIKGVPLPQLDNFCRFLTTAATNLKNQSPTSSESREFIKQIGKILLDVNAESQAQAVGKLIGIKLSLD